MNRRRHERYALELAARIYVRTDREDGVELHLLTRDVCTKGVFFDTPCTIPVGTEVELGLMFPPRAVSRQGASSSHIQVTGRVIRCSNNGMAISFYNDYHFTTRSADY